MTTIDASNKDYITVIREKTNDDGSTTKEITTITDPKAIEVFKQADLDGSKAIDSKEELAKFKELKDAQDKAASQLSSLSDALSETEIEKKDMSEPTEPKEDPKADDKDVKTMFEKFSTAIQDFLKGLAELLGIKPKEDKPVDPKPVDPKPAPADEGTSVEVNRILKAFDVNGDGFSSKEERDKVQDGVNEANSYLANAKETDEKGNVTRKEIEIDKLTKTVEELDTTTGKTVKKEVPADDAVKDLMKTYDKDGDGKLSASEQISLERDLADVQKLLDKEKDQKYVKIGDTAEVPVEPTVEPTIEPTVEPTIEPTVEPTIEPTVEPTIEPTVEPTIEPTVEPTIEPTVEPTIEPTVEPTIEPSPAEVRQAKLAAEFKNIIDNVLGSGMGSRLSDKQQQKLMLAQIAQMDAQTLKDFFTKNPKYAAKINEGVDSSWKDDSIYKAITDKLVTARRDSAGVINANKNDFNEVYYTLKNIDLDNCDPEELKALANKAAQLHSDDYDTIYDFVQSKATFSEENEMSAKLVRLLSMAE